MPIPRAYQNDSNAPWNAPPAPECPDCLETVHEVEDHAEHCECKETPEELHIINEEQAAPSYEPGGL